MGGEGSSQKVSGCLVSLNGCANAAPLVLILIDLQQAWPDIEGELLGLLDSTMIPT